MLEEMRNAILPGVPEAVYYTRQLAVASNSGLSVLDEKSAAHYLHWCEHPESDENTEALAFGKAFHMATLEPEKFGDTYVVQPADAPRDLRYLRNAQKPSAATLAAIDWWDTWEANMAGRIALTAMAYDQARFMGQAIRALRMRFGAVEVTCGELFDACQKEVTIYWVDEETGMKCKARVDLWAEDLAFAGDLKSCLDASREAFARAIFRHRYHVQHAHYSDGFRSCGAPLRSFVLFPVEKVAPYVPASWHVDEMGEERGFAIRRRSLLKLKRCLEADHWPGYTETAEPIQLPAYAFYSADTDA